MELDKAINSRKSVKKFKDKKPDWREIIECIDVMRCAPMAGNSFTLKFILVDDKEKIKKISEAAQQSFITQADYVLVVCSNNSRIINSFGKKGEIYSRQQAGAAIQNFLLKIQEKNLATCWIGHFVEEQIRRELRIPDNINIEAVFPVGYASTLGKPKRKISLDEVLYFNKYKNKKMRNPKKVDV